MKNIAIVIIIIISLFCGCSDIFPSNEKNKFIGTWKTLTEPEQMYTFFSDGSASFGYGFEGTWNIKDGKLILSSEIFGMNAVYSFEFITDNELHIIYESTEDMTILFKQD